MFFNATAGFYVSKYTGTIFCNFQGKQVFFLERSQVGCTYWAGGHSYHTRQNQSRKKLHRVSDMKQKGSKLTILFQILLLQQQQQQ
jgi:hypothetical protein